MQGCFTGVKDKKVKTNKLINGGEGERSRRKEVFSPTRPDHTKTYITGFLLKVSQESKRLQSLSRTAALLQG